jgi:adenylate kinase
MKRRVVLLGPPGSGKGTVAQMLETKFNLEHISTGQWFRKEMEEHTVLGEHVREYVDRGELVPDSLVLGLLEHWLTPELIEHGFLFDGFPRTRAQAVALDQFCDERNAPVDSVLYLNCSDEVILDRITGRRVCLNCGKVYHVRSFPPRKAGICDECGAELIQRSDDSEPIVRNRLISYKRITEPLVDYYQGSARIVSLDGALGSKSAYQIAAQVLES